MRPAGEGTIPIDARAHRNTAPLDVRALRERYRAERDKRIKAEGNGQYVATEGRFAHFSDDPWAGPAAPRAAVDEDLDAVIGGGGFGGLLCAARLKAIGIDTLRMIEKAGDFGGTWYWNRYPGAACDTESYIYLPLLETTGYMPRAKYARADEIAEHSRRIGRHFGLYDDGLFQTAVTAARWHAPSQRWHVTTNLGDALRARWLILAGGPLNTPKLPGIPGIDAFKGHAFHTSRWDYANTGGDGNGGLTGLAAKRVGIVGTGATAVQCVPHLGAAAKALYVFQRTPSAIGVRADKPTDPAWVKTLAPGWQRERMDNFTSVISGDPFDRDLVQDGWMDLLGGILLAARRGMQPLTPDEAAKVIDRADFAKMEELRQRVGAIVGDRPTADALKAWYKAFCKRLCFHDQFLQTFNQPNVHLIDTGGRGVERITENAIVAGGRVYEIDCLIYATGFEVGTGYSSGLGFDIAGRGGVTLAEKWHDGAKTLHGFMSRGFPNCFLVALAQSGQSANITHMLEAQSGHIAYMIGAARNRGITTMEPTSEAETAWTEEVVEAANGRQAYLAECTPGYYNAEGASLGLAEARNGVYWRGPMAFLRAIDAWRRADDLAGIEVG